MEWYWTINIVIVNYLIVLDCMKFNGIVIDSCRIFFLHQTFHSIMLRSSILSFIQFMNRKNLPDTNSLTYSEDSLFISLTNFIFSELGRQLHNKVHSSLVTNSNIKANNLENMEKSGQIVVMWGQITIKHVEHIKLLHCIESQVIIG